MIRQYRPLLGAAIALLATGVVAGELTLYEGENFQGRNLTLRSDMRDLDRTQFNDRAMSLVIRDGVWEVCSDAQFRGHCLGLAFDLFDHVRRQTVRRNHARRIAGVDAGVFDVLHDPTDHTPRTVGDGIDVGLEGILQETVDQHRVLRRHPHRAGEVVPE